MEKLLTGKHAYMKDEQALRILIGELLLQFKSSVNLICIVRVLHEPDDPVMQHLYASQEQVLTNLQQAIAQLPDVAPAILAEIDRMACEHRLNIILAANSISPSV
ncbi:hypothetical protein FO440_09855 [Mucilaginibacter corticis]|uniref:Uncharacterized protein n=1 Tax=Mucilaginibacter corticis TaxID=2597670 RepID=A0A556MX07_9SPHI|nr:hypothetical protein [Mucilaginibacter corticis]TSJ44460.1 hypothetical protein FO440_09855 [Mucilaginibacter corticis]